MLAFNLRLAQLIAPFTAFVAWLRHDRGRRARARRLTGERRRHARRARQGRARQRPQRQAGEGRRRADAVGVAAGASAGQTGIWGADATPQRTDIPAAVPSSVPTSATFAPARAGTGHRRRRASGGGGRPATGARPGRRDRRQRLAADARARSSTSCPSTAHPRRHRDPGLGGRRRGGPRARPRRSSSGSSRASTSRPRSPAATPGPVVTQYEVQPAPDIKVSRIEALADDLAMALAARSLRIEAPIPGKSAVGIEIPNKDFNIVALRRILEEVDFKASGSTLTFALGRDVAGKAQAVDLAKMPHLLIAGATGSGKSVMVNALIASLLCEATPDDVRMILMDLKRVELAAYNGLPHLLVPVITEPERAKAALKWAVNEMEARYRRLAGATARNIRAFNETRADPEDRMPYIVIVVDELADLMMREGKNVEDPIVRLAQKARATGIHLVLATQRPSVNVVTGLIKANFPSRIAFAMASQIDSRTILDAPGRGGPHRPRRHALPAVRPAAPDAAPGRVRVRPRDRQVVTHWKDQIDGPHYDLSITENDEEGDRLGRRSRRRGGRSPAARMPSRSSGSTIGPRPRSSSDASRSATREPPG